MVLALLGVVLLAGAVPASAHAVLTNSDPVDGSALDLPPDRVSVSFSESVRVEDDSIRVLGPSGARVDSGGAEHGAGADEATVELTSPLDPGTYVVSWRVVSADSHPVAGAFAFGIGGPPDAGALVGVSDGGGSRAVGLALGVARFASFVGAALLIGTVFFVALLWPAGARRAGPARLVVAGWVTSLVAALVMGVLQGLYTAGIGLSSLLSWDPLAATLGDSFGQLLGVRILALLLAVPLLRRFRWATEAAEPPGRWHGVELAGLGIVLAVTIGMIGHAGAGDLVWLATASTTLHAVAMAVWLGGLAVLALFLPGPVRSVRPGRASTDLGTNDVLVGGGGPVADQTPIPAARAVELARVLPRWSTTATICVLVLVATGLYQTWREVGALGALVDTDYGRLLLYKLWLVVGVLGLGLLARRWVRRHYRPIVAALTAGAGTTGTTAPAGVDGGVVAGRPPVTGLAVAGLRRGVLLEVAIALVVLALTAVLVNTIPARTSYAPPLRETTFAGPLTVDIAVSPTSTGLQDIQVRTFDPQQRPQDLVEARGELTLPSAGVGPLDVPLVEVSPGYLVAEDVPVPLPGEWQLRFTLRINDFDQYVAAVLYTVR